MRQYKFQRLKDWWSNLAVREQQTVMVGGIVVFVFVVYQFIWSPLTDHVLTLRKQIQTQQQVLTWMRTVDKNIQAIEQQVRPATKALTPVALLSVLQVQVGKNGLVTQLADLKQTSNNTVEIQFQKAPFDQIVRLLTNVVTEQRVSIEQLSATADVSPGIVNAEIVFRQ